MFNVAFGEASMQEPGKLAAAHDKANSLRGKQHVASPIIWLARCCRPRKWPRQAAVLQYRYAQLTFLTTSTTINGHRFSAVCSSSPQKVGFLSPSDLGAFTLGQKFYKHQTNRGQNLGFSQVFFPVMYLKQWHAGRGMCAHLKRFSLMWSKNRQIENREKQNVSFQG